MYIVAFNGPSQSGKDTLADFLVDHMDAQGVDAPVFRESLSMPLRKIAYAMAGWRGQLDGPSYEDFKRAKFIAFGGITGRQLMIDVSEKFLKPTYGVEIMAQMLIDRHAGLALNNKVILIRDTGFQLELEPLIRWVGVKNIRVVQVHRNGCSFEGDSREWVFPPLGYEFTRINNDGTLADLKTEAGRIYGRLVNQYGWRL